LSSIAQTPADRRGKKRIAVSAKRQITIPIEFYNDLGIDKEVECFVQNNALVIRPVQEIGGEFDEQILAELISQGLSGEELLTQFKKTRRKIRPAVEGLVAEAQQSAQDKGKYFTYPDVFGAEDK
jgi:bifunctional DNA-binding transcriptional regulator/antitoxin component of YhaV-PrlF toxin-antitoxin module